MKRFSLMTTVILSTVLISSTAFCAEMAATPEALSQNIKITPPNLAVTPPTITPPAPEIDAKGFVLMDTATGQVLAQQNMNQRLSPASLTKLMTLYLIFQALENKQITLNDQVYVSEKAWRVGGSRMFIKVGSRIPAQLLIQGIAVASGNDACVAMAEHIAGDEKVFAQLMNQNAAKLGMKGSHFTDSNGLPDPNHYTTPYDMALLARAIINEFPQYYSFFSEKWFTFNHIRQPNRNRLLWRDSSVDGLKTGHTEDAGFCLVASAKRENMRLLTVVLGAPSDSTRASDSIALLNYGFRFYHTYPLLEAQKSVVQARTWFAENKYTPLGLTKPLVVTIPTNAYKQLKAVTLMDSSSLKAPVVKGQSYGQVQVSLNNQPIETVPLIALENNPKGGMGSRLLDHITLLVTRWFGHT